MGSHTAHVLDIASRAWWEVNYWSGVFSPIVRIRTLGGGKEVKELAQSVCTNLSVIWEHYQEFSLELG